MAGREFRGYGVVIALACTFGLSLGFAPLFANNLSLFMKPLTAEFGWTRTQISAAGAMTAVCFAIAAPIIGRMVDRYGPRRVILVCAALFPLSVAAFALLTPNYPLFLLLLALVGLCAVGTTPLAYLAILPRWFDSRLGLAMGVAMVGIGLGYAVSPLVAQYLIEEYGWRIAFVGLGVLALLAIPNAAFLLRDRQAVGTTSRPEHVDAPADGLTAAEALKTRTFWALAISLFLVMAVVTGASAHMVAMLTDRGQSSGEAVTAFAFLGVALLVARLATGFLLDHVPAHILGSITLLAGGAGVLLLYLGYGGVTPIIAACLLGLAQGSEGDVMAFVVRRCFGMRAYGHIYGRCFAAYTLGGVTGPVLLALSYDRLGSYQLGLAVLAVVSVIAAALMFTVRPPSVALALGRA